MSSYESFRALLAEVCQSEGWGLSADQVELKFEDGRRQLVRVQEFRFDQTEMLRVFSVIGPAKHIDPVRLTDGLRLSFKLPHGAMALHDNELVIVDTLRAAEADAPEIRACLRYLAETADRYEKTMFGVDDH
ncbi:MAG: hypothetical protein AAF430_20665 [Myxococcota bacterium]